MKILKTKEDFQEHKDKLKNDPEYLAAIMKERDDNTMEYWKDRAPFKDIYDVPRLPKMNDYYINRLVELGAISKNELEDGVWYYGKYRNSDVGIWDAKKGKFCIWRSKFGWMKDQCFHFQDDDGYALFVPLRKATEEEIQKSNDGKDPR